MVPYSRDDDVVISESPNNTRSCHHYHSLTMADVRYGTVLVLIIVCKVYGEVHQRKYMDWHTGLFDISTASSALLLVCWRAFLVIVFRFFVIRQAAQHWWRYSKT